jgi:hypothetical protein
VERGVLNALAIGTAALPPDPPQADCAFGDCFAIAFREVDPPLAIHPVPRTIRDIRAIRGFWTKIRIFA